MNYLLIFLTASVTVLFSVPPIIKVALQKRLFDEPLELRKIHKRIIPNLGGIAIFTSFLFSACLFIPSPLLPVGNVLMAAGLIMFMTGLKDDIVGLSPTIKFVAQFITALIISLVADLRITNLHGVFEIYELNYVSSVVLTVFFIVGLVNAYNLIDGIDGLAGSLGLILSLFYAYAFLKAGEIGFSYLAMALAGALLGFLFYNLTPAKIFMGDSGSLLLGFLASIFSLKFVSVNTEPGVVLGSVVVHNYIVIALAIIIIPVFDTLRVFTLRIIKNTSPFTADSNHLHHRLLFLGLSHLQASFVLSLVTILFVVMALALNDLGSGQLIAIMMVTVLSINGLLSLYIEAYKKSLFSLSARAEPQEPVVPVMHKAAHKGVLNKIFKN
jgi:UDP-GlcNAc:undecaprenyl-phosphate GlcNAc-1-phosphate transferase